MEIQLVLGPNNSGKSLYAEKLAVESGSKRIYLATMIPQNEENRLRIEKHRLQRKYKGFQTIEAGWNIDQLSVDPDSVILLEDASNLLANGMFEHSATPQQVYNLILDLAKRCRKLIIVTIAGLSPEGYDDDTAKYICGLNWLNEKIMEIANLTVEMKTSRQE